MASVALLDIEGTIADIGFVKQVLFPYARRELPGFLRAHAEHPDVALALQGTAELAGVDADDHEAIVAALLAWMDQDRKATPLKALQGMVWQRGYEKGDFTAHLYPDAYRWLARQHERGVPLHIYSSGSIQAQKLYFEYSDYGNIRSWFTGFFDTTSGPKTEPESYRSIVAGIGADAAEVAFFSDLEKELDAAERAGLRTVQIVRPGTHASSRHPGYPDFSNIELQPL